MSTDSPQPADAGLVQPGSLSLILPAYNEEASLVSALERCVAALERFCPEFEIIVIDDASRDRTAELAESFAAGDPRVRVLRNERNVNYGVSLKRGIGEARFEWLFHNGVDLPLAPEDIEPLCARFDESDVLVAKRTSREAHSLWRRITSLTNNALLRLLFRTRCTDLNFTQFYRRSVVQKLNPVSTSPAFVTPELIFRAEHAGYRVHEVEMPFRRREAGQAHFGRPKDIIWTLRDMAYLRIDTWLRGWNP
jgi:glycosyltransferase involved in cell wall biosynthesis